MLANVQDEVGVEIDSHLLEDGVKAEGALLRLRVDWCDRAEGESREVPPMSSYEASPLVSRW
jgi:hypothetical protein